MTARTLACHVTKFPFIRNTGGPPLVRSLLVQFLTTIGIKSVLVEFSRIGYVVKFVLVEIAM